MLKEFNDKGIHCRYSCYKRARSPKDECGVSLYAVRELRAHGMLQFTKL